MKTVILTSRYGLLPEIVIRRDENTGEVSFRAARKATKNSSGDYYPGLEIDTHAKRAWVR